MYFFSVLYVANHCQPIMRLEIDTFSPLTVCSLFILLLECDECKSVMRLKCNQLASLLMVRHRVVCVCLLVYFVI